ncbi:MAG TPA: hemolysin, partial [Marinilabiliaceae bacterium]|nr:hemolysin [Marinilabiliaceae bacterium]
MSYIAVILITLFISAMLTGSEMAFLSSNKLMIEINRQRYPLYSKLTDIFYNNRQFFISTIFTGNLIALVVFAITLAVYSSADLMELTSSSFLTLSIQILLATIVILLFTRFLPKLIFRLNPIR